MNRCLTYLYLCLKENSLNKRNGSNKIYKKINHYLIIIAFLFYYYYYKFINRGQLHTISMYIHFDMFYFSGTIVGWRSWSLVDDYKSNTYHEYEHSLVCILLVKKKKEDKLIRANILSINHLLNMSHHYYRFSTR